MSIVEAMLRGIRTREGSMLRVRLGPDEEYPVPLRAPLVLCGLVAGTLSVDGSGLEPGGVVMLRGSGSVAPKAGGDGAVLLVCGYRTQDGGLRLTGTLPDVAVVAPDGPDCVTLLELLDRECGGGDGSPVVRDRLLDWLLTCTLNAWFAGPGAELPGWYTALADPVVGPALAALHDEPAHPWTVGELATRGGLGRAAFAKRFRSLVGSAPLAYLRNWRMTLATEYLSSPEDTTVSAVARRVGYADPFAFSAAFKRERGVPPSVLRTRSG